MTEDLESLYTTLQQLVSLASGVSSDRVILADQGRPPPEPHGDLYATYLPVPIRAVGHPRKDRTLVAATEPTNLSNWEDYEEVTVSQLDLMLSCNFLNGAARDAAWRMHNANFRWPVHEFLWTNDIAWRNASDVRRLTAINQAGFQPRYQVDVNLYIEVSVTDSVLRAADFSVKIEDEAGNVLYDGG